VGCSWLIHGTIISPGCRPAEGGPNATARNGARRAISVST
jgi:hypothetical protein